MRITCAVMLGAAFLVPGEVRADCASCGGFEDYSITESPAGTVYVCLDTTEGLTCPGDGLLRLDQASGDVVLLTTCAGPEASLSLQGCYLDECVPGGTYQYGLAVPYDCNPQACATRYFETTSVKGPSGACTRDIAAPVSAQSVPWSGDQGNVCTSSNMRSCGCGVAPRGAVLGTNLVFALVGVALWRSRRMRRPRA